MAPDEEARNEFIRLANQRKLYVIDRDAVSTAIKKTICGQDDTIDLIVEQIRNGFASNPKHREGPVGVFMLLGPPGTGKTSLARALADAVIGKDDSGFYTVDMNSCRDQHAAWTYFGAAQGYAGGRGILTSAIANRRGAPMVVLLDEFEKADSNVHRMFLSAWATGFIVDNRDAAQIDTRNTIWVLTSNAATKKVQDLKRSHGQDRDTFNEEVRTVLLTHPNSDRQLFAPEVLSRVNEFFCLDSLVFDESNQDGVTVGFQLIRNMLTRLATEYDLSLSGEDIDSKALGGTLHMLTTTFEKGGIRALRVWLRRQLASRMVDLRISGASQIRIDQMPGEGFGPGKLRVDVKS